MAFCTVVIVVQYAEPLGYAIVAIAGSDIVILHDEIEVVQVFAARIVFVTV